MKIKLLMTGLLGLLSVAAFAQKGAIKDAQTGYDDYNIARSNKLTMPEAIKDLNNGKIAIEKAAVNDKTATLPITFALKGAIYSALTLLDTVPATSLPTFKIADESLKKARSLDSAKQENKKLIDEAYRNLAQYQFDRGRADFQNKKYEDAYKEFDYFRQVLPDDTTALYATGLAASNAAFTNPKYYPYAVSNYTKLLTTNYSGNPGIYHDLAVVYLTEKDTVNALKIAAEGVAKYPTNKDLRKREIEISLQAGKTTELISKIEDAVKTDPQNKLLYFYEGLTYSSIGDVYSTKSKSDKADAAKKDDRLKMYDNYSKAAEQYKKAIAIDPNYFEANLNTGYVLVNTAIDEHNAANQLPTNAQKEYAAAVAKSNADFELAKPYIIKAIELNPKSVDALDFLKHYYLGKDDMVNANAIQKKIEALGGQ